MDQNTSTTLACHNCKTVTTDGGQQVWVCQNCGEENHAPTTDDMQAQAMIDAAAATTPAVPESASTPAAPNPPAAVEPDEPATVVPPPPPLNTTL